MLTDLKFRPDASGLLKIGKFCESFHEIRQQCQEQSTIPFALIESIRSTDFSSIFTLSHLIRRLIDVEGCKTSDIYMIREHISPDLDTLRTKYSNLPDFLVKTKMDFLFYYIFRLQLSRKLRKGLILEKWRLSI